MFRYHDFKDVADDDGLRVVLVRGMPSPWGQAAKTIFELKGLAYKPIPWEVFEANEEIAAWGGTDSAPIVAWRDERPVHNWLDILLLAERLAPTPSLIPDAITQKALMIGLSHEICGVGGLAWNRRFQLTAPAFGGGPDAEPVRRMALKYGYHEEGVALSGQRVAKSLRALSAQLASQHARDSQFFIGDALTALDIYWTAFLVFFRPWPAARCAMPDEFRDVFTASDPLILDALDPILIEHAERIFARHFRDPMEF
ncbi:glutathione S-transferase C-terminal domain-containing protein [Stakelama sp. CBK3Z-3]|uniref:Glutathione S-transferase C-terminal domain-containing protein n=1 Tax=Stakelama flava TaxID=2860338 RepID=A0ABS6XSB7_9SPHN|nr:glutathione S-transferase C-terminal domain-containing protein [Stakelama flava]MBW4332325.1 glutathione S-transferase C-terminal domain-containing protein [Stakelama flava]